jgi:L-asparaginase II
MIKISDTLRALEPHPLDFVEVAVLERDGLVESRHRGLAALVGPDGKIIDHLGATKRVIYPRSAVKPLQVVAMRRAGLDLVGEELAICAGSHHGTGRHIALVDGILAGVGLDENALQCPPAWPGNAAARAEAAGESKAAFNCSGKHAGFIAASKAAGWDVSTYLEPNHCRRSSPKSWLSFRQNQFCTLRWMAAEPHFTQSLSKVWLAPSASLQPPNPK